MKKFINMIKLKYFSERTKTFDNTG